MLKDLFEKRTSRQRKPLTIASVLTFSIAIILSLLIDVYTNFEKSYDTFYAGHDRIYRIAKDFVNPSGETVPDALTQAALGPALKSESPDVEQVTRMYVYPEKTLARINTETFYQERLLAADSTFFQVFNQQFIEGSADNFYSDANAVVIDESLSRKYFGGKSALGKTIGLDIEGEHVEKTVAGVIKDVPANAHFHFDMLIRLKAPAWQDVPLDQVWDGYDWYTYIKVRKNANVPAIQDIMVKRIERQQLRLKSTYYLQPVTNIHLHSNLNGELETNSSYSFIQFLFLIELLLLVSGILNFANFTIISAIYRLHELGVRKIHGASHWHLLRKLIVNVTSLLLIAAVIILGGFYLVLPVINSYFQVALTSSWWYAIAFVLVMIAVTVGIVALSLWFFLSRTNYVAAIKSSSATSKKRSFIMGSLIVFQFFVTSTMISSVIIVQRQISYLSKGDPGFLTNALMVIEGIGEHGEALKNDLVQSGVVQQASFTTASPGDTYMYSASTLRNSDTQIINDIAFVDYDYFDVMGIKVAEGRVFSREFGADAYATSVVINQTAKRLLGSKVIDDEITPNPRSPQPMYFKVIGVVEDFHSMSFHHEIRPMIFLFSPMGAKLVVRLGENADVSSVAKIKSAWQSLYKDVPFDSYFVEDRISNFYSRESMFESTFFLLGIGCLVIACSGLIVVSFLALRERRKEMCIRKVIGAKSLSIYFLSMSKMLRMIVIAIVISVPASMYLMKYWLSNFAYHIQISFMDFAAGGLLILIAAIAFASPFSLRLATGMPLTELRKE